VGLSKLFRDYQVESSLQKVDDEHTMMTIRQYYSPRGLEGKLVNVIAHRRLTRQTLDTMNGLKQAVEASEG
jgi:hypothetical protein